MNNNIRIQKTEILSDLKYLLKKVTFEYQREDGSWETQVREVYDRGDGAAVLLYNSKQRTVVLTSQFRLPSYLNGNTTGLLIEVCAGMLDLDNPEDCIRREIMEETGYVVSEVQKVFEAYMSPGALTEKIYFFIAQYTPDMKTGEGGGLEEEHEHIDVLELPFDKAYKMIAEGDITDAKTIMLLQYMKASQIL